MRRRLPRAVAALVATVLLSGCTGGIAGAKLDPKVAPPLIAQKGVLRAAIDLSYPPFGGTDKGVRAGLDVDVAAAIAADRGLRLEIVDAKPDAAAELVKARKADIALGALTVEQAVASDLAFAGPYISDAPALFSTRTATATIGELGGKRVAVQKDSYAYWLLVDEYGEESVVVMPTLRDAMTAAASGQADLAAGDAIAGAYLFRDLPNLRYNGQLMPAYPLGVAVSKENAGLEAEVRKVLDGLSASGVLATLRRKWVGDLPRLAAPQAQGSDEASPTP
jgi:ABC-type amino acid transport substrate-binding protein